LTQFALGRLPNAEDARIVADIHRRRAGGGTYASLMTAIVQSDLADVGPEGKLSDEINVARITAATNDPELQL
jgi:hypothetical protein